LAGSLVTNQVRAYDLLRVFGREGRMSPLGQAFAEYGRIDKTMHLLALCDPVDDSYRRRMNRQLTVQESRHRLARAICHGKRGQIMQAYREGQEDQLASLGLVLNAVVLWTTRYLDAAVTQLEAGGHVIGEADKARLSPLKDKHVNVLGRYAIITSQPAQGLRPLRDPAREDPQHVRPVGDHLAQVDFVAGDRVQRPVVAWRVGGHVRPPEPLVGQVPQARGEPVAQHLEQTEHHVGIGGVVGRDHLRAHPTVEVE
jgi:hypothetical protein